MREPDTPLDDENLPEPKNLRALRVMVTVLTATMILGILTILVLIVIKIAQPAPAPLSLPPEVILPSGETALAVTQGRNWFAIVTINSAEQQWIHIYDLDGTPRQVVEIAP